MKESNFKSQISEKIKAKLNLANSLVDRGFVHEAIIHYKSIIEDTPEFILGWMHLAEAYIISDQLSEAVDCYTQVIRKRKRHARAYVKLAEIQQRQNKISDSLLNYQRAVEIQHDLLVKVYKKLVYLLKKEGRLKQICSTYRSIIDNHKEISDEVHHDFSQLLIQIGVQTGNLHRVISFFNNAIKKHDSSLLYYYLGNALAKENLYNDAIYNYKKSIQINSSFNLVYIQLGKSLIKIGNIDEAVNCGIKSLFLNPTFGDTQTFFRQLFQHQELTEKKFQEIIESYKKVIDKIGSQPSLARLYIEMGKGFVKYGNISEAIQCNINASYHRLQKFNINFIDEYWKQGKPQNPNFLIIGVMKCGTTSLYDYVMQHPNVLPAIIKEPQFFAELIRKQKKDKVRYKFQLSQEQKDLYLSLFPPRPDSHEYITGEASNQYIWTPDVEKYIYNTFPDIKLIVLLRDPISRAISQYNHWVRMGIENRSLEEAFTSELIEIEAYEKQSNRDNNSEDCYLHLINQVTIQKYLSHGLYVYFLKRWLSLFNKDQLLVVSNEVLRKKPELVMTKVFKFLNLPPLKTIKYTSKNVGFYSKGNIDTNLIEKLANFYQPHNQKLEEYLEKTFNWN